MSRASAEVIMLTIPCIILFRISCNSSALCSNFHVPIILKIALKIIVKTIQELSNVTLLQSMTILLE